MSSKIKIFRYTYESIEDDFGIETKTGFVAGTSMGDAVDKLNAIETPPRKKDSNIIQITIYEIDHCDKGILMDNEIKDIYAGEGD